MTHPDTLKETLREIGYMVSSVTGVLANPFVGHLLHRAGERTKPEAVRAHGHHVAHEGAVE